MLSVIYNGDGCFEEQIKWVNIRTSRIGCLLYLRSVPFLSTLNSTKLGDKGYGNYSVSQTENILIFTWQGNWMSFSKQKLVQNIFWILVKQSCILKRLFAKHPGKVKLQYPVYQKPAYVKISSKHKCLSHWDTSVYSFKKGLEMCGELHNFTTAWRQRWEQRNH